MFNNSRFINPLYQHQVISFILFLNFLLTFFPSTFFSVAFFFYPFQLKILLISLHYLLCSETDFYNCHSNLLTFHIFENFFINSELPSVLCIFFVKFKSSDFVYLPLKEMTCLIFKNFLSFWRCCLDSDLSATTKLKDFVPKNLCAIFLPNFVFFTFYTFKISC